MTPEEIQNERFKLVANWCNTLSTAIATAGTFVPAAQFVFGALPQAEPSLVWAMGGSCVTVAVLLHFLGQWVLGGLE